LEKKKKKKKKIRKRNKNKIKHKIKEKQNDMEKRIRFNEICPKDDVMDCIAKRNGICCGTKLCIDACQHCPAKRHNFNDTSVWHTVRTSSEMSDGLRSYVSSHASKSVQGRSSMVVKYPNLTLDISFCISGFTEKQRHKIKALKREYFVKIRTAS
ncbi:hypothetical protein RFI_33540, partial [Reticulomyxa filosa]